MDVTQVIFGLCCCYTISVAAAVDGCAIDVACAAAFTGVITCAGAGADATGTFLFLLLPMLLLLALLALEVELLLKLPVLLVLLFLNLLVLLILILMLLMILLLLPQLLLLDLMLNKPMHVIFFCCWGVLLFVLLLTVCPVVLFIYACCFLC